MNQQREDHWQFGRLQERCDQLRAENERLRHDLTNPPADIQELVIKKLGLVSGEALAKAESALAHHKQLLVEAKSALEKSDDLIGEVAAYGSCCCDIPNGETCIACQCALQQKSNKETLAHINQALGETKTT